MRQRWCCVMRINGPFVHSFNRQTSVLGYLQYIALLLSHARIRTSHEALSKLQADVEVVTNNLDAETGGSSDKQCFRRMTILCASFDIARGMRGEIQRADASPRLA